jgi:tetratricopeptide (TPR) repeat protein
MGDLDGALITARSIVHSAFSAVALGDVVAAYAKEGNLTEARRLAARIRDERMRSNALTEIIAAQVAMGDIEGASAAAGKLEDRFARAEALAHVAAGRARIGQRIQARELFAQSVASVQGARGSPERKATAFVLIARAQVDCEERAAARDALRLALSLLGGVKRESDRLALLSQIAPLQARIGDHAGAMATARLADDASLRPLLVRDVAASQAEAGDVAGAIIAARTIDDGSAGVAAFFGILRVQSQTQDARGMRATIDAALSRVRVIRGGDLKAGALGSLAAAQIVAGDHDAARGTFEEAMDVAAGVEAGPARAAAYARIADALAERGR